MDYASLKRRLKKLEAATGLVTVDPVQIHITIHAWGDPLPPDPPPSHCVDPDGTAYLIIIHYARDGEPAAEASPPKPPRGQGRAPATEEVVILQRYGGTHGPNW